MLLLGFIIFLSSFDNISGGEISHQYYSADGLLLFTVDEASNIIYVGGINKIYKFVGDDLSLINTIDIGPRMDNSFCPADPSIIGTLEDNLECANRSTMACECPAGEKCGKTCGQNFPMLLHVDTLYNNLIVCSNLYQGFCEIRPLDRLTDPTPIYQVQDFILDLFYIIKTY